MAAKHESQKRPLGKGQSHPEANEVQFGKSVSAQPFAYEDANKVNISKQQQTACAEKETALTPEPCYKAKSDRAEVGRQELTGDFAQCGIKRLEECCCCAEN